ncbi:response regulator [Pseudoalteromonas denitrificans]|uniref:Response regulator receiver domain-containing protein n=1 Tax=Pseudoalteromonas denitrificans DSM 6059 TaxID=1123010 RepID=A0A1I1PCI2_9GAMM|nr:response regulator [Pseudoalteromonas denitrificans]SFD04713.1 Response regulator receiver domain-containing protein [Pseudoalteromonas denitrificans DSM 6059]
MSHLKILAVDDNQQNLNLLNAALSKQFSVTLSDGTESLELLCNEHKPDLILLDIMLGDKSGYDLCRQLRQSDVSDDIVIIFVSALSSLEDKLIAYGAGGDDYICKPIDIKVLEQKLLSLEKRIDQHHMLEEQCEIASDAAFTSMTYSNELGQLMSFFSQTLSISDVQSLYKATEMIMRSFGVVCLVEYKLENETCRFPEKTISSLEMEIFEMSSRAKRAVSFGSNLLLHSKYCTLLIKKIPIGDEEKSGRLTEHFSMLLEIMDSRLLFINSEMQRDKERSRAIAELSCKLEQGFEKIKSSISIQEHESQRILSQLEMSLNLKLVSIGLAEEEETEIIGVLQDTKEQFEEMMNKSINLDNDIRDIINLLNNVN